MVTQICWLEVDGIIGIIECYQANLMGKYLSYNVYLKRRLAAPNPWTGALVESITGKSFGNITSAEDWLLDQLENTSFLLLKFG